MKPKTDNVNKSIWRFINGKRFYKQGTSNKVTRSLQHDENNEKKRRRRREHVLLSLKNF